MKQIIKISVEEYHILGEVLDSEVSILKIVV